MDDKPIKARLLAVMEELRLIAIALGEVPASLSTRKANILAAVCSHYGVTEEMLVRRARTKAVSEPRRVAMFLMRELMKISLPDIGLHFDRDHTTVIYGIATVRAEMARNPCFAADVAAIRQRIEQMKATA